MSFLDSFTSYLPYPSNQLSLTLISLDDWALVTVKGDDAIKYLQGQLTCDVTSIDVNHFSFAAHCNVKGKMLSNLCLFYHQNELAFIERRSVRNIQIAELKKYAIFSNITISADDNVVLLGLVGFQAQETLSRFFNNIPNAIYPVSQNYDTTLLYFNLPVSRFLLVTTPSICAVLQQNLKGQAQFNDSKQWLAMDIEAGYPIIDIANSTQFIPQSANMHALDGICFNKGCYIGQEIVARAKYRGVNKYSLYWLAGKSSKIPLPGENLEIKIGNNWRRTGTVLASCQLDHGEIWVQALLNNSLNVDCLLRVCDDTTSILSIYPLPYVINK